MFQERFWVFQIHFIHKEKSWASKVKSCPDHLTIKIYQSFILELSILVLELYSHCRLVFSRFLDLLRNPGIIKKKPTRKTCFSREKICLAPRIHQAKFCLAAFLWSQRNLYYIFTRKDAKTGENIFEKV